MLLLAPIILIPFQLWGEGTNVLKFDHHRRYSVCQLVQIKQALCGTREAVMDMPFIGHGQIAQLGHANNNNSSA